MEVSRVHLTTAEASLGLYELVDALADPNHEQHQNARLDLAAISILSPSLLRKLIGSSHPSARRSSAAKH